MALIPDLPEATTVASTDVFIKDTGAQTQKITAPNLANQLVKTGSFTGTIASIPANGDSAAVIAAAISGYTLVGAIGYRIEDTGLRVYYFDASNGNLRLFVHNATSTAKSNVSVTLTGLFIKS